jgi:hypothetical protein
MFTEICVNARKRNFAHAAIRGNNLAFLKAAAAN